MAVETDLYAAVREKLNVGPLRYPEDAKITEILKIFWDEDTVRILAHFPPAGQNIKLEELVEKTQLPKNVISRLLRKAAAKKTITNKVGEGYSLEPLIPGVFEAYFIARKDKLENLQRVAELFRSIFRENSPAMIDPDFHLFRPVLPIDAREKLIQVEQSVDASSQVMPYELVEDLIQNNEFFAVIPCQCRLVGEMNGEPCTLAPSDMGCMVTGISAQATSGFGWGKPLSKEEAVEYLKKTEQAGLVHCTSYSTGPEHLMFICNCCPCHCGVLKPTKELKVKTLTPSNYAPKNDPSLCVECGTCVEKCPMGIITLPAKGPPEFAYDDCLGCGVCATNCPNGALSMVKVREDEPPRFNKLGNKIFMQSLGDLLSS